MRRPVLLVVFLLVCLSIGWAGGLATRSSLADWYVLLRKPPLTPPSWVFAPVWTFLYVLMAVAGWRIWNAGGRRSGALKALFVFQLALNGIWSFLFFGMRSPLTGLVDIVFLFAAVLLLLKTAWNSDRAAAYCLAPYALWLGFASYLNAAIWWLNR